jgi:hypothetical protein
MLYKNIGSQWIAYFFKRSFVTVLEVLGVTLEQRCQSEMHKMIPSGTGL